jgi:hypothetical protein
MPVVATVRWFFAPAGTDISVDEIHFAAQACLKQGNNFKPAPAHGAAHPPARDENGVGDRFHLRKN